MKMKDRLAFYFRSELAGAVKVNDATWCQHVDVLGRKQE